MPSSIDAAMQRSRSYWFRDGIPEIVVGIYFALVGVLFAVELALGEAGRSFSAIGLPVVVIGGMLASRWTIKRLKDRITHPRTGYVSYRQPPTKTRRWSLLAGALVGIGLAAFIAFGAMSEATSDAVAAIGTGAIFAVIFLAIGVQSGRARMFVLAVIAAASVGICLALEADGTVASAVMFLSVGTAQSVFGVVTLLHYLGETSGPEPDNGAGSDDEDGAGGATPDTVDSDADADGAARAQRRGA